MTPLDTPTQFNQNSFKTFRATVFTDRTTHKHYQKHNLHAGSNKNLLPQIKTL